jgi:hypothetical protein
VLEDKLTTGIEEIPTYYFKGALFNGVAYRDHSNGQVRYEANYKDGQRTN